MVNTITGNSSIRTHIYLLLLFSAIRCVWYYVTYTVGNDQCAQMNVAINIMEGRGIVYTYLSPEGVRYIPFNWFPPGVSFLMAAFLWLTGSPFVAEFIVKCLIAILEGAMIISIMKHYVRPGSALVLSTIVLALYTGHLDRGMVADNYNTVAGVWLMWIAYRRIDTGVRFDVATQASMAVVLPSMVLMKYNALPIVMVPLGMFLCLTIYYRQWYLDRREWVSLSFASLLSIACFIWSTSFIGFTNSRAVASINNLKYGQLTDLLAERVPHFLRIDPFWLHFGRRVDMYFKFIYSRFMAGTASSLIESFHFWQLSSLAIFAALIYFLYRKSSLQRNLLCVLFFFTAAQISFLYYMTIFYGPFLNSKWGVDGNFWTYMEEPRLFSHLTFAFMLALMVSAWRHLRPIFWGLAIITTYSTVRTLVDSKSELGYLADTYAWMKQTPPPDVTAEFGKNRRSFYVWHFLLGHSKYDNYEVSSESK